LIDDEDPRGIRFKDLIEMLISPRLLGEEPKKYVLRGGTT